MKLLAHPRRFGRKVAASFSDLASQVPAKLPSLRVKSVSIEPRSSPLLKTVGWVSAGVGALALGVVVGREIRQRYKFNRRTPYDFYAHSGDEHDMDFGMGI